MDCHRPAPTPCFNPPPCFNPLMIRSFPPRSRPAIRPNPIGGLLAVMAVALTMPISITVRAESPDTRPVDFAQEIRPLLSNRCFACHGPDEAERAAGLRLDTAESHEDLGGYAAIVPGDPDDSELMLRVMSDDPDMVMPPPDKGSPLSEEEIALLRRWIQAGATYDRHWSYTPPRPAPVPEIADDTWSADPIDRFALQKMQQHDRRPSTRASRRTLARRVALDLTGIPPTWDQSERFARDDRPDAYLRYVDRLLASPEFGERWARLWLDLARYADSAGYADDPPREIWAYRDYVIDSLNASKPFDQFTIEQIAGDLLPDADTSQLIATAFHRNTMTNNEGGTNDEEFRNVAVVDRTNTTFAVWMGTTMACAQCHTHKFDPITQEEYFRIFAFFNSSADQDRKDESPTIEIVTPQQRQQRADLKREIESLQKQLRQPSAEIDTDFTRWLDEHRSAPRWQTLTPIAAESESRSLEIRDDGTVQANGQKADKDRYRIQVSLDQQNAPAEFEHLRLRVHPKQTANFVLTSLEIRTSAGEVVAIQKVASDYHQNGFAPEGILKSEKPNDHGWAIAGQTGREHDLTVRLSRTLTPADGPLEVFLTQRSKHKRHLLDHFSIQATASDDAMRWAELPVDVRQKLVIKNANRSDALIKRLREYHRGITRVLRPTRQRLARAEKELAAIRPQTTVPVMKELPADQQRVTHIQIRGNYQSKGDVVTPGTPAALHPLVPHPSKPAPDRMDLARWLVAADNPLTARVIANRHWETLFGIGIVSTSEEFGSQGELPSHPELLDHLANELTTGGWDLKRLLRQIVNSQTYRQSSTVDAALAATDPDNRLLSRGPRHRIPAEMIRDQALAAAGLLSHKMHGPPVRPPQPELGLKAAFGNDTDWTTSTGEDRYRRGLYTMWRRSNPYPSMAVFDAPSREVCTVRRDRTNTPLQALVTLNDPVYVEAARGLAFRLIARHDSDLQRVTWAFRHALARSPTDAEAQRLIGFVRRMRQHYTDHLDQARRLTRPEHLPPPMAGSSVADDEMAIADQAAWTVACNVVLNLDEILMKR